MAGKTKTLATRLNSSTKVTTDVDQNDQLWNFREVLLLRE